MANDTTVKFRADISELKAAMQQASRAVKVANSEFKAATAGLDDWSKSSDGLTAKLKQLDTVLESQKKQLDLQEQELEKTVAVYGENSAAADRVRIAINNQKAAIAQTEKEINRYTKDLNDCQNGLGKFAKEEDQATTATDKLGKKIATQETELEALKKRYADVVVEQGQSSKEAKELADEIVKLSGKLKDNKSELEGAEKAADSFDQTLDDVEDTAKDANEGFTVMKGVLADLAATAIKAVVKGMVDLAKATFEAGSNFESAMANVAAISGANAEEMAALTAKAKEMGETTKYSATESAEAFKYMAMAGWETEDMLNGISGIMSLAAASGEDLGTTSDIVTDALTAMGYAAGDAGHLADVMAAASSNANTNVALMGATFQYAAPIVGALGYNMEDTAVAIGLMANAGIKGEKAGTALRSILTRLSAPPKEAAVAMDKLGLSLTDSEGNMKSLDEIVRELRASFANLSATEATQTAKALAGKEAMTGLLAVVNATSDDFERLTDAVADSTGEAERMANTMNNTVQGQITLLKSNIEGKMIRVYERASGSIKRATKDISKAIDQVNWDKVGDQVGRMASKVADLINYVLRNSDQVIRILKTVGGLLGTVFVTNKIAKFGSSLGTIAKGFTALGTKVGFLTTSVNAAGKATLAFNAAWLASPMTWVVAGIAAITAAVIAEEVATKKQIEANYGLTDSQKELMQDIHAMNDSYQASSEARHEASDAIAAEYDHIEELKNEYNSLIDANGEVKEGYKERADYILNELINALGLEADQIETIIDENGKLCDSIDAVILKKRAEATLDASQDAYTEAIQNKSDALDNYMKAQNAVTESEEKYKKAQEESAKALENYNAIVDTYPEGIMAAEKALDNARAGEEKAKASVEETKQALLEAQETYVGYSSTIINYEKLGAAVLTDSSAKINYALENINNDFITAEAGTRETLQKQYDNYVQHYSALKKAAETGMAQVSDEELKAANDMIWRAGQELAKLPKDADTIGQQTGEAMANGIGSTADTVGTSAAQLPEAAHGELTLRESMFMTDGETAGKLYADKLGEKKEAAKTSGTNVATKANEGLKSQNGTIANTGTTAANGYIDRVNNKAGEGRTAGNRLATQTKSGTESVTFEKSGENAALGFIGGIGKYILEAYKKGVELAKSALEGVKKGGQEGSPWKTTIQSGEWLGEGLIIGMNDTIKDIAKTAANLAITAYSAIEDSQDFKALGLTDGQKYAAGLKASVADVKSTLNGSLDLDGREISGRIATEAVRSTTSAGSFTSTGTNMLQGPTQNITFVQNNNSPKALDRLEIYRETNTLLFDAKWRLSNV